MGSEHDVLSVSEPSEVWAPLPPRHVDIKQCLARPAKTFLGASLQECPPVLWWRPWKTQAVPSSRHPQAPHAHQPLFETVRQGDFERFNELVYAGAELGARDDTGNAPLHVAALYDQRVNIPMATGKSTVRLGLTREADGSTAPHLLVKKTETSHGSTGKRVERRYDFGEQPQLYAASPGGRAKILTGLLAREGCDVDVRNDSGQTPLHLACLRGNMYAVEALVEAGADLHAVAFNGVTPLHAAIVARHREVVDYLLKKGAEQGMRPPTVDGDESATGQEDEAKIGADMMTVALFQAVRKGDLQWLETLVEDGVDVHGVDEAGHSVLHVAAALRYKAILPYLLTLSQSPGALDRENGMGYTPLHVAASSGLVGNVHLLVEAGASFLTSRDVSSPFHVALDRGHARVLSYFHIKGLHSLDGRDGEGYTALHAACLAKELRAVEALVEAGADLHRPTLTGLTPLDVATLAAHQDVVDYLVGKGATKGPLCDVVPPAYLSEPYVPSTPLDPATASPTVTLLLDSYPLTRRLDMPALNTTVNSYAECKAPAEWAVQAMRARAADAAHTLRSSGVAATPVDVAMMGGRREVPMDEHKPPTADSEAGPHTGPEQEGGPATDDDDDIPPSSGRLRGGRGGQTAVGALTTAVVKWKGSGALFMGSFFMGAEASPSLPNGASLSGEQARVSPDLLPLHAAVAFDDIRQLLHHLARGHVRINARDDNGSTALHLACLRGNPRAVKALVRAGADTQAYAPTANGQSLQPLDVAVLFNRREVAIYLLKKSVRDAQDDDREVAGTLDESDVEGLISRLLADDESEVPPVGVFGRHVGWARALWNRTTAHENASTDVNPSDDLTPVAAMPGIEEFSEAVPIGLHVDGEGKGDLAEPSTAMPRDAPKACREEGSVDVVGGQTIAAAAALDMDRSSPSAPMAQPAPLAQEPQGLRVEAGYSSSGPPPAGSAEPTLDRSAAVDTGTAPLPGPEETEVRTSATRLHMPVASQLDMSQDQDGPATSGEPEDAQLGASLASQHGSSDSEGNEGVHAPIPSQCHKAPADVIQDLLADAAKPLTTEPEVKVEPRVLDDSRMSRLQLVTPMHHSSMLRKAVTDKAVPLRATAKLSTFRVLPDAGIVYKAQAQLGAALDGHVGLHELARSSGGLAGLLHLPLRNLTDLENVDAEGYTALHWACKTGKSDMVRALVDAGADLQAQALVPDGTTTPLDLAVLLRGKQLANYLMRKEISNKQWQPNPNPPAREPPVGLHDSSEEEDVSPRRGSDDASRPADIQEDDPLIELLDLMGWKRSRPGSGVYESLGPPATKSVDTTLWGAKGKYSAAPVDRMRQPIRRDQALPQENLPTISLNVVELAAILCVVLVVVLGFIGLVVEFIKHLTHGIRMLDYLVDCTLLYLEFIEKALRRSTLKHLHQQCSTKRPGD